MSHLESLKVVHRELCTKNVLIGQNGLHAKLTGFSLAREVYLKEEYLASGSAALSSRNSRVMLLEEGSNGAALSDMVADEEARLQESLRFLSPEALDDHLYSTASDVYAFGVLVWEVAHNGERLYAQSSAQEVVRFRRSQRLPPLDALPAELQVVVIPCCQGSPKKRPRFETLHARLLEPAPSVGRGMPTPLAQVAVPEAWLVERNRAVLQLQLPTGEAIGLLLAPPGPSSAWPANVRLLASMHHMHLLPTSGITEVYPDSPRRHPIPARALAAVVPCDARPLVDAVAALAIPTPRLREMLAVEVLLALEYLFHRRMTLASLSLEQCFYFQQRLCLGNLELVAVVRGPEGASPSPGSGPALTGRAGVEVLARFLRSCLAAFPALAEDRAFGRMRERLQDDVYKPNPDGPAIGSDASLLSTLCVYAQDTCRITASQWQVPWEALAFVRQLGSGQFGEVALMTLDRKYRSPNEFVTFVQEHRAGQRSRVSAVGRGGAAPQLVAVKRLIDAGCRAEFEAEMGMMTPMRHANLVTMLHVVMEPAHQALVLEYLSGGSLDAWLRSSDGMQATDAQKRHVAYCVACGVAELGRLDVVHRDLAARNVLVSPDAHIVKVRLAPRAAPGGGGRRL
jgi:serine/threonine protein kinase